MNKLIITENIVCIALIGALLTGCHQGQEDGEAVANKDVEMVGDTLCVNPQSVLAPRLICGKASDTALATTLTTTGVVEAIPSAYAEVAAPFSGRVVRSLVRLGQQVKAGTPLFEIASKDYSEVVKNCIQSRSEMEMAKRALDRTEDLHNAKVASEKELEEARTTYSLALEEYRHAMSAAKEYQIDLKNAEVGQPMTVRSPISGKVLRCDLVTGEYLKEDADAKVVVAALERVWVKANVSEMDAPLVVGVTDAEVCLMARPDSVVSGKVTYVGALLDAETRTVQTVIECSNPGQMMLPNMYAQVRMQLPSHRSLVIPKKAVLQGDKGRYVLRRVGKDRYVRTHVEVQSVDENYLRVLSGLTAEDEIVMQGAFYLTDF